MKKKVLNISIIILVFILIIVISNLVKNNTEDNSKENNKVNDETISKYDIETNQSDIKKIDMVFEKHTEKDNVIPENLIELQSTDIKEVYTQIEYNDYEFMLCADKDDTLHLVYTYNNFYYSILQTKNNIYAPKADITKFENVLGYSGIKVILATGAAAVDIWYIAVEDKPLLLLSDSLGSEFKEYDIDEDGQKELMAFDNFAYIKVKNELYKARYDFDKKKINAVIFEKETGNYVVAFADGNDIEYKYDKDQKSLIPKMD